MNSCRKNPGKITTIKSFINKHKWEGVNFPSGKDDWKKLEKNNVTLLFMFCIFKRKIFIYILPMFQKIIQIMKSKLFF